MTERFLAIRIIVLVLEIIFQALLRPAMEKDIVVLFTVVVEEKNVKVDWRIVKVLLGIFMDFL